MSIKLINAVASNNEQQHIDSSVPKYGCKNGSDIKAWMYLASSIGLYSSASYLYTALHGTCKPSHSGQGVVSAKINNFYAPITPGDVD